MANQYYCYPREGFVPQTRALSDGSLVAHAGDTPFWCAQDMRVFRLDDTDVFVQQKVYQWDTKKYAKIGPSGHYCGHTYPGFSYRGTNYDVHRLMAMAWIGPIPKGWQVDHINGDFYNWSRDNIRIVTVAENIRCAKYLRVLRKICPLHAQTFRRDDYLHWFSMPLDEFASSLTRALGPLLGPEQMMKESFYDRE